LFSIDFIFTVAILLSVNILGKGNGIFEKRKDKEQNRCFIPKTDFSIAKMKDSGQSNHW
jgi:hypothetical protein